VPKEKQLCNRSISLKRAHSRLSKNALVTISKIVAFGYSRLRELFLLERAILA